VRVHVEAFAAAYLCHCSACCVIDAVAVAVAVDVAVAVAVAVAVVSPLLRSGT